MAGLIPREFIDQLVERSDIVAVIGDFVTLSKSGNEFKACCPFHNEKTPSFFINPSKQFYHCFGCGASGNVVSYLMEDQAMSFVESIEYLAAKEGIDVPREQTGQDDDQQKQARAEQQALREIHEIALRFFRSQWKANNESTKKAIAYVKNRKISGEIAREFELGLAPESWDALSGVLSNFKDRVLEASGLVQKRKNENGYYDRFRGRIMFPIWDAQGRTIAFGGRIFDEGEPKYLNSPETPIFHKSYTLYGLNKAREHIRKEDRALVVEGYMDVVMLAMHGVRNAIATLGTAITQEHLRALFKISPNITLCMDGDGAGRKAAWRGLQIALPLMEDGRSISFLFLEDGKDPDDVVNELGAEGFLRLVEEAQSFDEYFFGYFAKRYDLAKMDQKAAFNKEARNLLQSMPTGTFRKLMFDRLSEISGMRTSARPRGSIPKKAVQQRGYALSHYIAAALINTPDLVDEEEDWTRFINLDLVDVDIVLDIVEIFKKHQPLNTAMAINALQFEGRDELKNLIDAIPKDLDDDDKVKEWFLAKKQQLEAKVLKQRAIDLAKQIEDGVASEEEGEEFRALIRRQKVDKSE